MILAIHSIDYCVSLAVSKSVIRTRELFCGRDGATIGTHHQGSAIQFPLPGPMIALISVRERDGICSLRSYGLGRFIEVKDRA